MSKVKPFISIETVIDNRISVFVILFPGLDDEAKVSFTEHVFLEDHLEPWCPKKGPVRNFMDLVCVGLSKNPYYTVQQKVEHIEWYKNYFEEKKEVLERSIIQQSSSKKTPEITQ